MKPEQCRWMYNRNYPTHGGWKEFVLGVSWFIDYEKAGSEFRDEGKIRCPCANCKCRRLLEPDVVKLHLYEEGFKDQDYMQTAHGNIEPSVDVHFRNFSDTEALQRKSAQTKAARASKKGGSLHTDALVTMRTKRRLDYDRSMSHDEVFQDIHTKKKEDGEKNEYKQSLEEYIWSQSTDNQDEPSKSSERSFNHHLPTLSASSSSSSSQSSVNQDKSEDELEATRRQLEVTLKHLHEKNDKYNLMLKYLHVITNAYNAEKALRVTSEVQLEKDIELLKTQVNFLVKSFQNKRTCLATSSDRL